MMVNQWIQWTKPYQTKPYLYNRLIQTTIIFIDMANICKYGYYNRCVIVINTISMNIIPKMVTKKDSLRPGHVVVPCPKKSGACWELFCLSGSEDNEYKSICESWTLVSRLNLAGEREGIAGNIPNMSSDEVLVPRCSRDQNSISQFRSILQTSKLIHFACHLLRLNG